MRRAAHNVVKLPIEFSFILIRVFSLKVATFCSNPFEHVYVWSFDLIKIFKRHPASGNSICRDLDSNKIVLKCM